jgi:CDGSH-type Zn-finger protein
MIKDKKSVSGQQNSSRKETKSQKVVVSKDGPYIVSGRLPLGKEIIKTDNEGISAGLSQGEKYPAQETYALCRCGDSKSKPFCDGTHAKVGFDGTETASRKKYITQAEKIDGPGYTLTDVPDFCAVVRACHQAGGIWRLTEESDDPTSKKLAAKIAGDCISGRLVVWDNETGEPIEPKLEPSASLIEDPQKGVSGPIFLKGGVPVESADGKKYETRNRVTLCRCGMSDNKPFCDGSHISCGFNDGDESIN